MNSKRVNMVMLGVIGLLFIGLIAGTYGTNVLLTKQAANLVSLKAKNMALGQEQLSLTKAKKEVAQYSSLEKITQAVVPQDKDQAEAVREIVNIATQNNVTLSAINFPASSLGATSGTAVSPTAAATTPSPAAAAASSKAGALSQLIPVKNIPGVYSLIISINGDNKQPVSYNQFIGFLAALEQNRRTAQVSGITITPNATDPSLLSFSLTLNEYIKP